MGRKVSRVLTPAVLTFTPAVALTEIEAYALRHGKDTSRQFESIRTNSAIVPISVPIAREAARLKAAHGLFTVDAIVYACAQQAGAVLLTTDKELLPFKGVTDLRRL